MFCMFFFSIIQIPVPKGRSEENSIVVVLRRLKNYYKLKTGLKYLRLLHDNSAVHNARNVTEFLESENVTVLLHPQFSPDLPLRLFSVSQI